MERCKKLSGLVLNSVLMLIAQAIYAEMPWLDWSKFVASASIGSWEKIGEILLNVR